jgi:hypothetical protein
MKTGRAAALVAVKTVHTLAFFSIGFCLAYLFLSGLRKKSDGRAALAAAVVTGETLIYAGNHMRCPLTDMAEKFGAANGSVSDIYLPNWVVSHLAEITAPIFAEAIVLHAKNIFPEAAARGAERPTARGSRYPGPPPSDGSSRRERGAGRGTTARHPDAIRPLGTRRSERRSIAGIGW